MFSKAYFIEFSKDNCGYVYNENEEWIVHASDGVLDEPADLSRIEVSQPRDLGGGLAIAIHGGDEMSFSFGQEVSLGEDLLRQGL